MVNACVQVRVQGMKICEKCGMRGCSRRLCWFWILLKPLLFGQTLSSGAEESGDLCVQFCAYNLVTDPIGLHQAYPVASFRLAVERIMISALVNEGQIIRNLGACGVRDSIRECPW